MAVSAAVGTNGTGTQIPLSSEFNINGIYTDGTTYLTGGLDGTGYSYSANLLMTSRVLNGTLLDFGSPNVADVVGCSGQSITLPAGKFSGLMLLATGVEGNQVSQTLVVNYTDGTSSQFVQSFSDWFSPQKYPGELEAVAMAYRNFDNGTKDQRTFNLYAYRFALNPAKVVQSITLPNDSKVLVLAATLLP
ncbi:MAG: Sedolisin [Candidatus Sulfotelmatobacter sp.]|nr:Sedolisin [Candidatus Sulfotelmatobacter sp.]